MHIDKNLEPLDQKIFVFGEAPDGFYIIPNAKPQDSTISTLFKIKRYLNEGWKYTEDKELLSKFPNPFQESEMRLRLGQIGQTLAKNTIDEYLRKSSFVRSILSIDDKEMMVTNLGQEIQFLSQIDDKTSSSDQLQWIYQLTKLGLVIKDNKGVCHFVRKLRTFLNQLDAKKALKKHFIVFEKNKFLAETLDVLGTLERMGYGNLFLYAVRENDLGMVKLILEHIPDIHETHLIEDMGEVTYLEMALEKSNDDTICSVLSAGFDIDASFTGVGTLISEEIQKGERANLLKIKNLIRYGAQLDIEYENHHSPLVAAVLFFNKKVMTSLIDYSMEFQKIRIHEMLLFLAVEHESLEIIKFLLTDMGAKINARDAEGNTVLFMTNNEEILSFLISNKARVNFKNMHGETPLWLAVRDKDLARVIQFTEANADVNSADNEGTSLIHLAVSNSPEILTNYLISNEANVNVKDRDGRTPLHLAVEIGHENAVRQLIHAKANVNARDRFGETPLFKAFKHPNILELLIAAGAKANIQNSLKQTAIRPAIIFGSALVVKTLLEAGAGVQNDYPLLVLAGGNVEKIKLLIAHGANVNEARPEGSVLFEICKDNAPTPVIQALVEAGADVYARNKRGDTPLFYVLSRLDVVEIFIKAGADVNVQNRCGTTPLIQAAAQRTHHAEYARTAERLIQAGAIVCMRDKSRQSAYHHATTSRNQAIARMVMNQKTEKLL